MKCKRCEHEADGLDVGSPDCEAEAAPIRKAAQVAAIRQRLSDWWEGCCAGATYRKAADTGFIHLVEHKFKVQIREQWYSDPKIDSLAAWLWERGVRG